MNIHEHQAKEILKAYGAPVSNGIVIFSLDKIKTETLIAYGVYQIESDGLDLFEYIKGDKDSIMGLPIFTVTGTNRLLTTGGGISNTRAFGIPRLLIFKL